MSFGQTRRKDDNSKDPDTIIRENDVKPNHETPAEEIVRLKEAEPQNTNFSEEVQTLFFGQIILRGRGRFLKMRSVILRMQVLFHLPQKAMKRSK